MEIIRQHISPLLDNEQLAQLDAFEIDAMKPKRRGRVIREESTDKEPSRINKQSSTLKHYTKTLNLSEEQKSQALEAINQIKQQTDKAAEVFLEENPRYAKSDTMVNFLGLAVYTVSVKEDLTKEHFRKFLTDEQYNILIAEMENDPERAGREFFMSNMSTRAFRNQPAGPAAHGGGAW